MTVNGEGDRWWSRTVVMMEVMKVQKNVKHMLMHNMDMLLIVIQNIAFIQ